MSRYLFVSGMFRSGTTLFARMINTHREVVCASDPFRPFYKSVRDAVAADLTAEVERGAPLGDYFADPSKLELFDAIQDATLDLPFRADSGTLLDDIVEHGEPYSPFIAEELDRSHLSGDTYAEVLENLLAEVPKQYGDGGETWVATKETWTTEFTPALARTYPDSKFLFLVRDPRAVCASKYSREEKYPWLFLARQWRKIALLAHLYADEELASRAHVVRYEDLVTRPEETAADVCEFLNVELDETILSPENFTDGRDEQWLQNTAYEGGTASFNTDSVSKWKNVLDRRVVGYLEELCFAEMGLHGYEREGVSTPGLSDENLVAPPSIPRTEFAGWMLEHYPARSPLAETLEHAAEAARGRLLQCEAETIERTDGEVLRGFFLRRSLLEACRAAITGGEGP